MIIILALVHVNTKKIYLCLERFYMFQNPGSGQNSGNDSAQEQLETKASLNTQETSLQILGDYELLEKIGQGESSIVYKAREKKQTSENFFVVKVLKSSDGKKDIKLLENKREILAKLQHKAFSRWIKLDISKNDPYIVLEYIEGKNLQEIMGNGTITKDIAIHLAYSITEAVSYLHSQEYLHQDLKPSHILIPSLCGKEQNIRILDFGISALRHKVFDSNMTDSFIYISPEETEGKKATFASDIYCLGLILYELLAGIYPYDTIEIENTFESWKKVHQNGIPRPLFRKNISPTVAEILLKCLNKNPAERPAANQILEVLEKEIARLGVPSYIGILGVRGSGKTCYITSLYGCARPASIKTRKILEEKYLDLVEKGILPNATALSAYQFHFIIDTAFRSYEIITQDYGGELLVGRIEELQGKEKRTDEDFHSRREEIYYFFQNARAVLIIVEALPAQSEGRYILNYREQIYSLTDRLAYFFEGKRRLDIPVAFILTKWDRMMKSGDITDPEIEKKKAIDYIHQNEWLKKLYSELKNLCPCLEVFPVSSFEGDKPTPKEIRHFNVTAPMIWAADMGEKRIWEKCLHFEIEHQGKYHEILENYWRILHVEKIIDEKIRKEAQESLERMSKEYFQSIQTEVEKKFSNLDYKIKKYKELLQTKGIQKIEKEEAEQYIHKYQNILSRRRKKILQAVLLILGCYFFWEVFSDYTVKSTLCKFEQGEMTKDVFLQNIHDYRKYKAISIFRYFQESKIYDESQNLIQERFRMENLSKECEDWGKNWENKIEKLSSYKSADDRIKILLQKIEKSYLVRIHQALLQETEQKIRDMRSNDLKEFEGICENIRLWKFKEAKNLSDQYRKNAQHKQIMARQIDNYWQNFLATVNFTISIEPSEGFSDPGEGPEFYLTEAKRDTRFESSENMKPEKKNIGSITKDMDISSIYELKFLILERDTFRNDDYGEITFEDIGNLLNHESISKRHKCLDHGILTVFLEVSEIKPKEKFPEFGG